LESGYGRISVLWDAVGNGQSNSSERAVFATQSGLHHGIALSSSAGFVYASTQTDVYRWKYTAGQRTNLGSATHVISNLPCCHHTTRTLRFSPDESSLYVQSGSGDNVDSDASHAQIRRWKVSSLGSSVVSWTTGELLASGNRNEVGLRFDPTGRLWGVENGVDDVARSDWNIGDIHNDNPCEEINLFDTTNVGGFYGYPYCWSEGILPKPPGKGTGTQWLYNQQTFPVNPPPTDAWCQNKSNVIVPAHCLPAHNAPLDIIFGNLSPDSANYQQTAYVSAHGSWDRTPPDGYDLFRVMWNKDGSITHEKTLAYNGSGATGNGWIRPVALGFVKCTWGQCLIISTDSNNELAGLSYRTN